MNHRLFSPFAGHYTEKKNFWASTTVRVTCDGFITNTNAEGHAPQSSQSDGGWAVGFWSSFRLRDTVSCTGPSTPEPASCFVTGSSQGHGFATEALGSLFAERLSAQAHVILRGFIRLMLFTYFRSLGKS